jgi:hypothetical protein
MGERITIYMEKGENTEENSTTEITKVVRKGEKYEEKKCK